MSTPQQGARQARCPRCQGPIEVIDSRASTFMGAPSIRRRRSCSRLAGCGHRFTTYEISTETIGAVFEQMVTTLDASTSALQDSLQKLKAIINDR